MKYFSVPFLRLCFSWLVALLLWIGTPSLVADGHPATGWMAQTPVNSPPLNAPLSPGSPPQGGELSPPKAAASPTPQPEPQAQRKSEKQSTQSSGGPYDLKAIEESYRSLYGS